MCTYKQFACRQRLPQADRRPRHGQETEPGQDVAGLRGQQAAGPGTL